MFSSLLGIHEGDSGTGGKKKKEEAQEKQVNGKWKKKSNKPFQKKESKYMMLISSYL